MQCSNIRCSRQWPTRDERCPSCQAIAVGRLVGHRYRVERVVGRGGFGITYLVHDEDCLDEPRVLKQLCPDPYGTEGSNISQVEDDIAERLFRREAKVLLKLQHSGIPQLYAYFSQDGYSYLVQDYIPGNTLAEEVNEQKYPFDEYEARLVLHELADILDYLHTQSPPIIHRDIKPENLMRHKSGRLLLIDFGAVCQVAINSSSQTFIYSPGYTPPEQIAGHPMPQSDLYAAGATILRLLTGSSAHMFINNRSKRMNWEACVQVTPQFAAIINNLMEQDFSQRLSSAKELKARLNALPPLPVSPSRKQPLAQPLTQPLASSGKPAVQPASSANLPTIFYQENDDKVLEQPPIKAIEKGVALFVENSDVESGSLAVTSLPFLMSRFLCQRLSGAVTCIDGSINRTIFFDKGEIVAAESTVIDEQLEEIVYQIGDITAIEIGQITAAMNYYNISFSAALLKSNLVTPEELKLLLIKQVSTIVYACFEMTHGRYEIELDRKQQEKPYVYLSIAATVLEGMRRMDNIELIKRWLGDFNRQVVASNNPLLLYQSISLSPQEAFIVSRVDTIMTIEEILSLSCLSEVETLKTICGLLAVGIVEIYDEESDFETVNPAEKKAELKPVSEINYQFAAEFCYEVEILLRNIDSTSHYSLLNVKHQADSSEIKNAYNQMVKKFHPQQHALLIKYNPSLQVELERIFKRISDAYHILIDPSARKKYDTELLRSRTKSPPNYPDRRLR